MARMVPGSVSPHVLCRISQASLNTLCDWRPERVVKTIVPLVRNEDADTAPAAVNASSNWILVGQFGRPRFKLRKKATCLFILVFATRGRNPIVPLADGERLVGRLGVRDPVRLRPNHHDRFRSRR